MTGPVVADDGCRLWADVSGDGPPRLRESGHLARWEQLADRVPADDREWAVLR